MEEGVVVEVSTAQVLVWVSGISRCIPVQQIPSWRPPKIGTFVRVKVSGTGEIVTLEVSKPKDTVIVKEKEIRIATRVIFPPKKLLPKIGLKLFSSSIGIITVKDEEWRPLFDKAADMGPTVFEASTLWFTSSREFVLEGGQTMKTLEDVYPLPTYLSLLKQSPWAQMIVPPPTAEEVLKLVLRDFLPKGEDGSSSSDDELPHESVVTPDDFVRMAILMKKDYQDKKWHVFYLDCDEPSRQWGSVTERTMDSSSDRPYPGAIIEIDLCKEVNFNVKMWSVVKADETLSARLEQDLLGERKVMLDVAVRVEKVITIGGRNITVCHNKRVLDVYDYHNVLGVVKKGDIVRVLIRWGDIHDERIRNRKEWIVHGFGTGEPILPKTRMEMRKLEDIDQARDEYRLVEYTLERDWHDNPVLRKYKRILLESEQEEKRMELEKQKKRERERREEEEIIRRKQNLDGVKAEDSTRQNELLRLKLADMSGTDASLTGSTADTTLSSTHTVIYRPRPVPLDHNHNQSTVSVSSSSGSSILNTTRSSIVTINQPNLPKFGDHLHKKTTLPNPSRDSSIADSVSSSISQETVIRAPTAIPVNLNQSRSSNPSSDSSMANTSQSSIRTQTTAVRVPPTFGKYLNKSLPHVHPSDSGQGSTSTTPSTVSQREKRSISLMNRMRDMTDRDMILKLMIDKLDSDWMEDLHFVLGEYNV